MNNPSTSTSYRNPALVRLKSDHAQLSTEINQLNRELLILKDRIRRKQKDLRGIKIALIHKATHGPFLTVVPFSPSVQQPEKQLKTPIKASLHCLHGGRQSCK